MKYAVFLLVIPAILSQADCAAYVASAEASLAAADISYPGYYVIAQNYWDAARCYKPSDAQKAGQYYAEAARYYTRAADLLVADESRNKGLSYELAAESYGEMGDAAAMQKHYGIALAYFSARNCDRTGNVCAEDVLRVNQKLAGATGNYVPPLLAGEQAKTPDRVLLFAALLALFLSIGAIPLVWHYARRRGKEDDGKYQKLAETGRIG